MASFDLSAFKSTLNNSSSSSTGVDFSGKSLKLDNENDGVYITY